MRSRTPGSDWAVVRLARRGRIDRVELDTHFFKGNAPQAALIEALDEAQLGAGELAARIVAPTGWEVLVDRTALVQHRRHQLEPSRPMIVTHVRVHIFPHGGVNRLRLFGQALDTPGEAAALAALNALGEAEAGALFLSFNGSTAWGKRMIARRPFPSVRAIFAAADEAWWEGGEGDWLEAFAAHPRIGATQKAAAQDARSAAWSHGEQKGVSAAAQEVRERLGALNEAYFQKFGFIYIVFATGKTAAEMLALLEERIGRGKGAEIEQAAREQAKITRVRIEKWLREQQG
jgi:allantoicase